MNKKKNEYWPTILIMEGRPYRLKELNRQGINNPCELCDLRRVCGAPDGKYHLTQLCKSDDRDDTWFFEEDWTFRHKRFAYYLDLREYKDDRDCLSEDEVKDLTLKHDL